MTVNQRCKGVGAHSYIYRQLHCARRPTLWVLLTIFPLPGALLSVAEDSETDCNWAMDFTSLFDVCAAFRHRSISVLHQRGSCRGKCWKRQSRAVLAAIGLVSTPASTDSTRVSVWHADEFGA